MSDSTPEKGQHNLRLSLPAPFCVGLTKVQADLETHIYNAGLFIFNEGLFKLGKISEEKYLLFKKRYSVTLEEAVERKKMERGLTHVPVLTIEQRKEKALLESKDKGFQGIIQQWNDHKDVNWRFKVVQDAEKYKDKLQSARDLLALAEKQESAI